MTAETASEQAAQAGDVPTSQDGQLPDGVLATHSFSQAPDTTEETPKVEEQEKPEVVPETLDPKDKRKSDKEWQEAQETKKVVPKLEEKVEILSKEIERMKFEKDHPIIKDYAEEWEKMNTDPRFDAFTNEEKLAFIHKPDMSTVKKDLSNQAARTEGTVMGSGRPAPVQESVIIPESAIAWFGSEKEARKAYEKYGKL